METKTCPKCDTTKSRDLFSVSRKRADGLAGYCKACVRLISKAHYMANRERLSKQKLLWKKNNPEHNSQINQSWRDANKERIASTVLAWRRANPDLVAGYSKKYRESDPDKYRQRDAAGSARRRNAVVRKVDFLALRARDGDQCCICGSLIDFELTYPDRASPTLEHVVPLSRGGSHTQENTGMAHWLCNVLKNDRLMSEIPQHVSDRFIGNYHRTEV